MMECDKVLAVPTMLPGGLDAAVSQHFGETDGFTVVGFRDGAIAEVAVLASPPHEHGGCMIPVRLLAAQGVHAVAVGGIGERPFAGFGRAGIEVLACGGRKSVQDVADAWASGGLPAFAGNSCCEGEGHHHAHGHEHGHAHGHGNGCCGGHGRH